MLPLSVMLLIHPVVKAVHCHKSKLQVSVMVEATSRFSFQRCHEGVMRCIQPAMLGRISSGMGWQTAG